MLRGIVRAPRGLDRGYGVAVSGDGKQVYVASADDETVKELSFTALEVSDTTAPYSGSWTANKKVAYGAHTLTARAIDARGLTAESSINVNRIQ